MSHEIISVSIAGTTHRIACPASEKEIARANTQKLDQEMSKLRESVVGKNPSNEELLVLHCLELYDQINELKTTQKFAQDKEQRVSLALDQLLKNAKDIAR